MPYSYSAQKTDLPKNLSEALAVIRHKYKGVVADRGPWPYDITAEEPHVTQSCQSNTPGRTQDFPSPNTGVQRLVVHRALLRLGHWVEIGFAESGKDIRVFIEFTEQNVFTKCLYCTCEEWNALAIVLGLPERLIPLEETFSKRMTERVDEEVREKVDARVHAEMLKRDPVLAYEVDHVDICGACLAALDEHGVQVGCQLGIPLEEVPFSEVPKRKAYQPGRLLRPIGACYKTRSLTVFIRVCKLLNVTPRIRPRVKREQRRT